VGERDDGCQMDMAMNILSTADMSNETQQLPLDELSPEQSIRRSESVLSNAPTYRDDIPTLQVHPPQVILEKSPELIRTHSCPPHTPEEALGVIPVPEQFNEQATRRMEWIMQMGMDTLLPTLRPEQRKIIEGTTDLWQLLIPLLQSWEHFRATDGRKTKAQKLAKSVYEKVKTNFTNNEIFDRFWQQKMVAEQDEAGWRRFKGLVSGMLQQVSLIDRILDSAGMGNVGSLVILLIVGICSWESHFWCCRPFPQGILPSDVVNCRLRKRRMTLMKC
jgi:hypothetical protein